MRHKSPCAAVRTYAENPRKRHVVVRFARPSDVEALAELERRKWAEDQAASPADLLARIETFPTMCLAAFSTDTGAALASLFLRPASAAHVLAARTWAECATGDPLPDGEVDSLFGISLSSVDAEATARTVALFRPQAATGRWGRLFLGSPMPGLRAWRERCPSLPVEAYAFGRRNGRPRDAQLRYYHGWGAQTIEAVKPGYFPHEASLDHAALLSGDVRTIFGAGAA